MGNILTPVHQQPPALPPLVTPDPLVLTVDSSSSEGSPNPKRQKSYGGPTPPSGMEGVYYTLWSDPGEITDKEYAEMATVLLEKWGIDPDELPNWAKGSKLDWMTMRWVTMDILKTAHDEVMQAALSEDMLESPKFNGKPAYTGRYCHGAFKRG